MLEMLNRRGPHIFQCIQPTTSTATFSSRKWLHISQLHPTHSICPKKTVNVLQSSCQIKCNCNVCRTDVPVKLTRFLNVNFFFNLPLHNCTKFQTVSVCVCKCVCWASVIIKLSFQGLWSTNDDKAVSFSALTLVASNPNSPSFCRIYSYCVFIYAGLQTWVQLVLQSGECDFGNDISGACTFQVCNQVLQSHISLQ